MEVDGDHDGGFAAQSRAQTRNEDAHLNVEGLAVQAPRAKEPFRNLTVKVHIRKAGRVAWKYVGRAHVIQEFTGHTSRVVIRSASSGKVLTTFSELSEVQADKRGSFIVVAAVDTNGVTSWSLNAINNSDALKLLASIELACYRCTQAVIDPAHHSKTRRRIEKMVREDRRRRHYHKKQEEELAAAFEKLGDGL